LREFYWTRYSVSYNQGKGNRKQKGKVETMTRVEREKRIKELETRLFFLNMVDRPTYEDYKMMTEVENEIRRLKGIA
jgi:hypothetical protein